MPAAHHYGFSKPEGINNAAGTCPELTNNKGGNLYPAVPLIVYFLFSDINTDDISVD